jgi:hypothetical protein
MHRGTPSGPLSFFRGVAHLCRFDLQRFRLFVAVVVALELLRAALAEWVLHRGPLLPGQAFSEGVTNAAFEFQALDGALWLATALTTAIVIQADHPADDRGFLRSRPVGPWTLAIAKLLDSVGWRSPFAADTYLAVTTGRVPRRFALPMTDWQWVDDRGWLVALAITLLAAGLLVSYHRTRRAIASAIAVVALIGSPALIPEPASAAARASPELVGIANGGLRLQAVWIPGPARTNVTWSEPVAVRGDLQLPGLPANVAIMRRLGLVHVTGPGLDLRTAGIPALIDDSGRASAAAARSAEPVQKVGRGRPPV